jgi:acetyl-CoA C-acetyltransferase
VRGSADHIPGQDPAAVLNPAFREAGERTAARASGGAPPWRDPREDGLLPDAYIAMGQTAENVAQLMGVSRRDQDEYAALSQNRAERAIAEAVFEREITPVSIPGGRTITRDDGPRPGVTVETLATLQPVFRPDGTVTAGNACPLNDGAAALVVVADDFARERGLTPLARVVATAVTALSPEVMGLGPVEASRKALRQAGMTMGDIDLVELNEAFAAQVVPCARELGVDHEKLNVHGGAIALGHPFGMTGARITATLLNALRTRDVTFGLETMCVGGGQGMAMVLERLA